jgi:hypothetical protein
MRCLASHTGAIIPGQLGPTMRDLFCDLSISVMRTMSVDVSPGLSNLPSVCHTVLRDPLSDATRCKYVYLKFHVHTYVTIRGISAAMASSILFAATGGLSSSAWSSKQQKLGVRDENGGRGSSSLFDSVRYARKDGPAEVLRARLLGVRASDDIRA